MKTLLLLMALAGCNPETGRLDNPQAYFESVVGVRIGDPAPNWEMKLAASGIPEGYGPGVLPNYADHFGITQQIATGGPRGVVYLPTAQPDDNGYYTTQILVVDQGVWVFEERFPNGPDYAPGVCQTQTPPQPPPPDYSDDFQALLELLGEQHQYLIDFRTWAEQEIAAVRAEHKAQPKASKVSSWGQVLMVILSALGIGVGVGVQ